MLPVQGREDTEEIVSNILVSKLVFGALRSSCLYNDVSVMPIFLGRTVALNMTVFLFFPFVSAFSPWSSKWLEAGYSTMYRELSPFTMKNLVSVCAREESCLNN